MLHTFNALRAVRSCCLATGGAARCSAAGERLIAGRRPTVLGRVASAGAKSDCVLEAFESSLTPWAPRLSLDRIYIIDLVKAPLSVCVLPHLRLPQLVESPATGDDPRRIRERTAS